MPGGDGTGPMGQGSRTGRARGYCAGYPAPGYMSPGIGRGLGRGRGFGRGMGFGRGFGFRRFGFAQSAPAQIWEPVQAQPQAYQLTKEQEMQMLEDEKKAIEQEQEALKQEIEEIKKRAEELEKGKKEVEEEVGE